MTPRGPRAAPPLRQRRSALRWILALCGLLLLHTAPLRAQEIPPGLDQGLFELRVAGGPPATVPVLVDEQARVLLPLLHVLEETGLPYETAPDTSLVSVPLLGGPERAVLDLRARELRVRGRTAALGPREAARHAGEVYLRSDRLAELLEAKVQVDFGSLRASVLRDPPFPVEQRALLAARRAILLRQAQADSARLPGVPYRARSGVGVVDWSVGTSALPGLRSSGRLVFGAAVLGGALTVGGSAGVAEAGYGLAHSNWIAAYSRVFPEGKHLRQLHLGDVTAGGLQAHFFRGVMLSNAPYRPQVDFARTLVNPDIPPGWEYEVFQDGRLLGFSEGGAREPVSIPLEYGTTRAQVRMYGPAGEEVVSELRYLVPFSHVAPGRWEYTAGGGLCPATSCRDVAFFDLRHGVSPWLTLGAGASTTRANHRRDFQPHAVASLAAPGGWAGEVRYLSHAFTRGSLSYHGRAPVWLSGLGGVNHPGAGLPSFLGGETARWDAGLSLGVNRPTLPPLLRSLRLGGRVEGEVEGAVDRTQLSAGWSAFRSLFEAVYESNRLQDDPLFSLQATMVAPERGPAWLRGRALTTRVGVEGGRFEQLDLATSVPLARTGEVGIVARWDRSARAPSLTLGYSADLGSARIQSRVGAPAAGGVTGAVTLDGGLAFGERVGALGTDRGGVGSAGVAGVVFHDRDGDGHFGEGDEAVPEVKILIGALRAVTDRHGRYELWGVPAYDVAAVRVDTLSLADPSWVPQRDEVRVRPVPHAFNRVDLALGLTRELAGRLVAGPGVPTVGGVALEIEERETGTVHRTTTFSDGEFYVSRLRPGEYRLRVAESSLEVLGARAEPEALDFSIRGEEPAVELPPVRLLSRTPPPEP